MLERFICQRRILFKYFPEGRHSFQIVEMSLSNCSGLLARIRPLLPIPLAVDQVCEQFLTFSWKVSSGNT